MGVISTMMEPPLEAAGQNSGSQASAQKTTIEPPDRPLVASGILYVGFKASLNYAEHIMSAREAEYRIIDGEKVLVREGKKGVFGSGFFAGAVLSGVVRAVSAFHDASLEAYREKRGNIVELVQETFTKKAEQLPALNQELTKLSSPLRIRQVQGDYHNGQTVVQIDIEPIGTARTIAEHEYQKVMDLVLKELPKNAIDSVIILESGSQNFFSSGTVLFERSLVFSGASQVSAEQKASETSFWGHIRNFFYSKTTTSNEQVSINKSNLPKGISDIQVRTVTHTLFGIFKWSSADVEVRLAPRDLTSPSYFPKTS